jgi:hypothetical protein
MLESINTLFDSLAAFAAAMALMVHGLYAVDKGNIMSM